MAPESRPIPDDRPATSSEARNGASRCVVVIDDNADVAESVADVLNLEGHRVHIAFTGHAGIEIVRQSTPDVVFCDVGLPDLDGFEVARRLRSVVRFEGKLVAFTGSTHAEDRHRSAAAGFDQHLAKPADAERIIEIVRSASTVPARSR